MPVNPNTGLYEREPASITPPGIFDTALEGMNSVRATSLSQEAQQRNQLENLLLGLSAQKQQKDQALRDQYIAEMARVSAPQQATGPVPAEQDPVFSTRPGGMEPPSTEDILQRGEVAAMKYGQPGAYQYGNLAVRNRAVDVAQQRVAPAEMTAQAAMLRAQSQAKLVPIRARLDAATTNLRDVQVKLGQLELAQQKEGTSPRIKSQAIALESDILRSETAILQSRTSIYDKTIMPDERTDAMAQVADAERMLLDSRDRLKNLAQGQTSGGFDSGGGPPGNLGRAPTGAQEGQTGTKDGKRAIVKNGWFMPVMSPTPPP